MLEELKKRVFEANLELVRQKLVIYTWGNVSEIDRTSNLVVIKPSGVKYDVMKVDDMVVLDLLTGEVVEGSLNPSSDTPTHLEIYKAFKNINSITHTHSINAVAFAQAGLPVKALGTTHADYFYGDIPCTNELDRDCVLENYEKNTGILIVNTLKKMNIDPNKIPAVLVKNHGPFTFGKDAYESVYNAKVLDVICEMNIKTLFLNKNASMNDYILDKHYYRKHGKNAYYGQN